MYEYIIPICWSVSVNSFHVPKILLFPLNLSQKSLSLNVFSVPLTAIGRSSQLITEAGWAESFSTETQVHLEAPYCQVKAKAGQQGEKKNKNKNLFVFKHVSSHCQFSSSLKFQVSVTKNSVLQLRAQSNRSDSHLRLIPLQQYNKAQENH